MSKKARLWWLCAPCATLPILFLAEITECSVTRRTPEYGHRMAPAAWFRSIVHLRTLTRMSPKMKKTMTIATYWQLIVMLMLPSRCLLRTQQMQYKQTHRYGRH